MDARAIVDEVAVAIAADDDLGKQTRVETGPDVRPFLVRGSQLRSRPGRHEFAFVITLPAASP